jgi:MoaA/NifB/PqqE/SkfB family radical SAM enzyme
VVSQRTGVPTEVDPKTRFGLGSLYERLSERLRDVSARPARSRAQSLGTCDGKGILFVSHDGDVYPAGFLPITLGNVRTRSIVDIYRDDPLLRAIRATRFGDAAACASSPIAAEAAVTRTKTEGTAIRVRGLRFRWPREQRPVT